MKPKKRSVSSPHLFQIVFSWFRLSWRKPLTTLLLMSGLGGGGWHYFDTAFATHPEIFQGTPKLRDWKRPATWFRVLHNKGFSVGYSDIMGNPLWVAYQLHPVPENAPNLKRPKQFGADWRGLNRVEHKSYSGSGYDRGHLAPNYAMSRLYGQKAQNDSFLMTNISPQKPKLNQKWWQRLEAVEIDYFAKTFGKVWVMTGPVFDDQLKRLSTSWAVEVPDAFYKIFIAEPKPKQFIALAFLVPQTVQGKEPLDQFLTTIDDIEAKTGLDFFADLDDEIEKTLEAKSEPAAWQLKQLAKLPSRY